MTLADTNPPLSRRRRPIRGAGSGPGRQPCHQDFWVATSAGTGTRSLEWDKTYGAWSIVAMRIDGEPGLDVTASMGLRFGFLLPVGGGALIGGGLVLGRLVLRRRPAS